MMRTVRSNSHVDLSLLFQGYEKMMNKISFKREKIVDIQKALQTADTNQDSKLDFEEWRQELKM